MKTAAAIRHVFHEDLGLFAPVLEEAGYAIRYLEAWRDPLSQAEEADLLVVLGGPIGAYQENDFPFLIEELRVLERRLAAGLPTIGFCLGAQLIARALGARVYPGPRAEIGYGPVTLTEAGRGSVLSPVDGLPVLHWHGDTFDIPEGCELLASSALYEHQAFSRGANLLALQFHLEVTRRELEAWLVGAPNNLGGNTPAGLRAAAEAAEPALVPAGRAVLSNWLRGL